MAATTAISWKEGDVCFVWHGEPKRGVVQQVTRGVATVMLSDYGAAFRFPVNCLHHTGYKTWLQHDNVLTKTINDLTKVQQRLLGKFNKWRSRGHEAKG